MNKEQACVRIWQELRLAVDHRRARQRIGGRIARRGVGDQVAPDGRIADELVIIRTARRHRRRIRRQALCSSHEHNITN
jgi:hypothetical protein